jgi:hypothetical protein
MLDGTTRKSVLDGTVSKEADVSHTHFPVHNDDKRDVHGEKCMLEWGGSLRKSEHFRMYGGREWWVGGKNGQWLNGQDPSTCTLACLNACSREQYSRG